MLGVVAKNSAYYTDDSERFADIFIYIQFYRRLVFRPQLVTDYTSL